MIAISFGGNNGLISPKEWLALLQQATSDVFSMMVGIDVTVASAPVPAESNSKEVTGMVGIAGAISAICSVRCTAECATGIASRMLGIERADAVAQQCDAIGEICNMVAGQFKAKIGLEAECSLSVPTVITGRGYRVRGPSAMFRLELPVLFDSDTVLVALEVRV